MMELSELGIVRALRGQLENAASKIQAIAPLTEMQRVAVMLRLGYSQNRVAYKLGIPRTTLQRRLKKSSP